jgi:hypothetical protein
VLRHFLSKELVPSSLALTLHPSRVETRAAGRTLINRARGPLIRPPLLDCTLKRAIALAALALRADAKLTAAPGA